MYGNLKKIFAILIYGLYFLWYPNKQLLRNYINPLTDGIEPVTFY